MVEMAIENSQLVDKDSAQDKTTSSDQSFGWNRTMHVEDGFEMLVEILNRNRTGFVQDLADLYSIVMMRIRIVLARMRGDQHASMLAAQVE